MNQIIAVPRLHHGLGNRVRLVLSARDLAEQVERDFAYVWPTGAPFGARLDELWNIDFAEVSTLRSKILALRYPYRDAGLSWMPSAERERTWQIRSSQPVLTDRGPQAWQERLRALEPAPAIATQVRRLFEERYAGRPYLGVMIRSHAVSHQYTLQESPLQWYVDRIAEIRRHHPQIPIYVSADTPAAQDEVTRLFPGAFGLGDKGPYNSRQALQASVVDLYMLASSTHLLAPHYSSFPELAQYLAGGAVRLETSMTGDDSRFDAAAPMTLVADPTRPSLRG